VNRSQTDFGLHPEDVAATSAILERWSAKSKVTLSLAGVVDRWSRFVEDIERGYELTYYDYTNDLADRDILEEILNSCTGGGTSRLHKLVQSLDARFLKATREARRPLSDRADQRDRSWWRRIPLLIRGELEEDLRNEGLAQ
jgi:hypothetical protein